MSAWPSWFAAREPNLATLVAVCGAAWILCVLAAPTGPAPAVASTLWSIVLSGVGAGFLGLLERRREPDDLLLCLPIGFAIVSGGSQLAAENGGATPGFCGVVPVLAIPGALSVLHEIWRRRREPVPFGALLGCIFFLIAVVYVLPLARRDGVPTPSGGRQWLYGDGAFHSAVAQAVRRGGGVTRNPGFLEQRLNYHFGAAAQAAVVSTNFRLDIDDAMSRVVKVNGLLALTLAVTALARFLCTNIAARHAAPALSLALVFFVAAPAEVLANRRDSFARSEWTSAPIPDWLLASLDRQKVHLFGYSMLWGMIAIYLVAALWTRRQERPSRPLPIESFVGPLALCLNVMAGAGALACLAFMQVWRSPREKLSYLHAGMTVLLGVVVARLAHLVGGDAVLHLSTRPVMSFHLFSVVQALLCAAFSFKLFACVVRQQRIIVPVALLSAGYLTSYVLVSGTEDYPLLLWASSLDAVAGAGLAHFLTEGGAADRLAVLKHRVPELLFGIATLCVVTLLIRCILEPTPSAQRAMLAFGGIALVAGLTLRSLPATLLVAASRLALIAAVLGVAGAARLALGYGWGFYGTTVEVDAGRTTSLLALASTTPKDSIMATTHHSLPNDDNRARSYVYAALSGRQFLVEGWEYATRPREGVLSRVVGDNAAIFTTKSPETARQRVLHYRIDYLLCEPEEALTFLPVDWVEPFPIPGTLKAYHVVRDR